MRCQCFYSAVMANSKLDYSSRQVKRLFHSLTPGEIAVRAQSKTLEKMQRNIAGKPAQLKTNEARMVKWIKEYNRSS